MRNRSAFLTGLVLVSLATAPFALAQDTRIETLPDSPVYYTYSTNTYLELVWYELTIPDHRGISGWSIDYTWQTLDDFFGTFYAQSPAGTVYVIGFAEAAGTYDKSTDRFDDEWADGSWIFWVEDVQGFGEQQAIDITVTYDYVPADAPFDLVATTSGDTAQLTWKDAVDENGLQDYRIYRGGAPIIDLPAGTTSYADVGRPLGTWCYVVTAVYDGGEAGSTDQDCTTIYPPGTYGVPDSPLAPVRYHSYLELGWTDVEVIDRGIAEDWSMTFTWTNTNGYTDGSLHAESPSGTLLTVGSGLGNGTYTIGSTAFNGESAYGIWKVWIEDDDTFGDGQYRVTGATMTLDVDRTVPTALVANGAGTTIVLDWLAPQDASGLLGYNLYRDGGAAPVATTDNATVTWTDTDIAGGQTYCYQVGADYGPTESLWPIEACAGGAGAYPVPDSPPPNQPNTYYCNSWTEAGWTEVDVSDQGTIAGWQIVYDWETNWAEMGRFYAMSPSGTQFTIGQGQTLGHYEVNSAAFNGEQAQGAWRLWIVDDDFFCDASHRAINITMSVDVSALPGQVSSTVSLQRLGSGDLVVRWEGSDCGGADDYSIYEGSLGSWDSHTRIDCSDSGGDLQETISPTFGSSYYLVVPRGDGNEGSYGRDSTGQERPVGVATCAATQVVGC